MLGLEAGFLGSYVRPKFCNGGYRMRHKRAWTMPAEEARTFLQRIQEKIASSDIEVPHRDVLIRLRSIILALISGSARRPRLLVIPTLVEVAEGSAPEQGEPAAAPMLRPVVQHVAALTERLQVRGSVVGWVVIEMRAGEDHARRPDSPLPQPQRGKLPEWSASSVTPLPLLA